MNLRNAAFTALLVSTAHKLVAFGVRFMRDEPEGDHERRIFAHLNGLVEAVVNQLLNRTFAPVHLRVVD